MPIGKVMTRNSGWVSKPKGKYNYERLNPLRWMVLIAWMREYPDRLQQLARKADAPLDVAFLQAIILRAAARYQNTFVTGARGTTKTFCATGSQVDEGTLYPGMMSKHIAPTKDQSADILNDAIKAYEENFPLLMAEWKANNAGADSVKITNKERSSVQSHATLPSNRGGNLTRVIAEECGQEDKYSKPFNWEVFRNAIRPSVRVGRKIKGVVDEYHIPNKELYITSATSQQNPAFEVRKKILEMMKHPPEHMPKNRVGTGIALGNSWVAPVVCGIRDIHWAKAQMDDLLPEERLREMGGLWTGIIDNPMVPDAALGYARVVKCAEFEHCEQPHVHYVLGIDTSYSNADGNAMCAVIVIKATPIEKDGVTRLLREVVNIFDFLPPSGSLEQARIYKRLYNDYTPKTSFPNAGHTLIAIDASIGNDVVADLMRDLGDGLPPLKCTNGWKAEMELENAIPAILPVKAQGGNTEQEYITLENADVTVSDMFLVADLRKEFQNRNFHLLIPDINEGVAVYNRKHSIKDSFKQTKEGLTHVDSETAVPYIKTREFVGQVRNLKVIAGREQRVSVRTNRDMWSAAKVGNRAVMILEKQLYRPQQKTAEPPARVKDFRRHGGFGTRRQTAFVGRRY